MHQHARPPNPLDLARAAQRLRDEIDLLCALEARGRLSPQPPAVGAQVEAWVTDTGGRPVPQAGQIVAALGNSAVVAGRTAHQVTVRIEPQPIAGTGLARLMRDLQSALAQCQEVAQSLGLRLVTIGILPTVDDADLDASHMSAEADRVAALAPARIAITGIRGELATEHLGIVPAAAATSLRAELQVTADVAARFYNASLIGAFAANGLAANAPFLFGVELWEDTRVALLEPATGAEGSTFIGAAEDYFRSILAEPIRAVAPPDALPRFAQLRLHGAQLPRLASLQIGLDADATPHLRIEQRALSSGPTPVDMMANLCFQCGLTASLATEPDPPEKRIDAATARANLLAVARGGLGADIVWLDQERMTLRSLLVVELIERAYDGLSQLGVDDTVAQQHLSVIERRVASGQSGAVWQRRFVQTHGRNFALLTREYVARQLGGAPVHEWNLRRFT